MRFASSQCLAIALCLLPASASPGTDPPTLLHRQRYAMGTMFDIVVYHASRPEAERAVASALEEIVRLDGVLSHFKSDSDLSKLVREGRNGFVAVEPSLYEVIEQSIGFSRRSRGRFDVTIAPLLRAWKEAAAQGRRPAGDELSAATRCVGYEKIETRPPNRIRFHSDCLELDLGGIGKGYAVDRAIAVLRAAGMRNALVNAGNSSIASIGAPPGRHGWPVELGARIGGSSTFLLRDTSISTSQQKLTPLAFEPGTFGEILDPVTAAPLEHGETVSVVAPSATVSDALSTTLLLLSSEEGAKLLAEFADVSAIWISPAGELTAAYRGSQLRVSDEPEILVRWDQDRVAPPQLLGIASLTVPAQNTAAVRSALAQGYRVYLEVDASDVAAFSPPAESVAGIVIKGNLPAEEVLRVRQRIGLPVRALDERGKWPHIRANWVTKNKEVLQVAGRSLQPWIDTNLALIRTADATRTGRPLLTYSWTPVTLSERDEGPDLENYLVAIAEAGSFGADLLLPLHERFQKNLLLDDPLARSEWNEIRRYLDFYSSDRSRTYQPIANIAVVTAAPAQWFEVMNLLARHNLPFELIAPTRLVSSGLGSFDLLIVLDAVQGAQLDALAAFARQGHAVVLRVGADTGSRPWQSVTPLLKTDARASYRVGEGRIVEVLNGIGDPNSFAFEMRQILGRNRRAIDVWNGITVLTAAYQAADGEGVVVRALNYAHLPLPVQLRVRGIFSLVRYETPEEPSTSLPYEHRDGYTEFVLPSLRIGGRVALSRRP